MRHSLAEEHVSSMGRVALEESADTSRSRSEVRLGARSSGSRGRMTGLSVGFDGVMMVGFVVRV